MIRPDPATPAMLGAIATAMDHHGVTDRADRIRLCRDHVGRYLTSSKDLTAEEAGQILQRLSAPGLHLQARLAQLRADDEALAAVRAKVSRGRATACSRGGQPIDADMQAIADFGEQLELTAEERSR